MAKTNFKEIAIYAINAFYDGEYANFSKYDFMKCGIGENTVVKTLKELCEDGLIEKHTKNGFYPRYKIANPIPCPKFIFNTEITISDKLLILKCKKLGINSEIPTRELATKLGLENHSNLYTPLKRIALTGKTLFEYVEDNTTIDLSKPNLEEVVIKEFGWQYKGTPVQKKEKTIENFLLKKSWNRFKDAAKILEYDLTEDCIKELLEKQEYKDFYTGIKPEDYHEYSIDRIDSSKGYIQGNVVITTNAVNMMKGEMSIEEFLNRINTIHNNQDKIKSLLS